MYFDSISLGDDLWNVQRNIILNLAVQGPCIIVSRCADYIFRDEADCLTVFIHAFLEKRAERIVNVYGQRSDSPKKRLLDKDKRRKAYYQFYTGRKWGDIRNYQLALDSGVFGIDKCVNIITELYRSDR